MKADRERGAFGDWLRRERTARFKNVPLAVAALQRQAGYGIAPSVWAELESGSRRPSAEQRRELTGFFGTAPEEQAQPDLASLIAALAVQVEEQRTTNRLLGEIARALNPKVALPAGTEGASPVLSAIAQWAQDAADTVRGRAAEMEAERQGPGAGGPPAGSPGRQRAGTAP